MPRTAWCRAFVCAAGSVTLRVISALFRITVSVAVSLLLALLPTLILWAWRERRLLYIALGLPVFLGFAAFSLSSAIGFAAKNRGSVSEDRTLATGRHRNHQGEPAG